MFLFQVCDDHEQLSEVPSSAICQFMFQDTATAMMESVSLLPLQHSKFDSECLEVDTVL